MELDKSVNVFGEELELCGVDPLTGYYRDGKCSTCDEDAGSHTICVEISQEFLQYSRSKGNDLSTPIPRFGFKGLEPGDSWCVCAVRWLEALKINKAPKVYLQRTHIRALDIVPIDILKKYAVDLN